jgi:D-alanyl-D-alanine carboxypeptidase-like protein
MLRLWPALGLLLVVAVLAGIALGDQSVERGASERPARTTGRPAPAPIEPQLYAVRRRGGVPPAWTGRARRAPGVTAVTRTARTQVLLTRSTRKGGDPVDTPRPGYAIPLDALVVRPKTYASVLPADVRRVVRRLRRRSTLLPRTSARVRHLDTGDRITLASGRSLRVAGVIADHLARDAELVLRRAGAGGTPAGSAQLLVATTRPAELPRTLPDDRASRITPVLPAAVEGRGGIVRAVEVKARFGEFAVRLPYGDDWIEIEPGWLRRHIVTRRVPVLGNVTCHRALIGPLRRALAALERRGLSDLVDPADYAGCYTPRRIPQSGALSLHAWGLAIDLNAAANPQFGPSRQDRRLVRTMERVGFTWGGRWPTAPDPMHFELHGDAPAG